MYRVSPFTYFVEGILGVATANTPVSCGPEEFQVFSPPAGQTCGEYMTPYMSFAGGELVDPAATTNCQFCQLTNTDVFLDNFGIKYSNRWRNFGIIWVYVIVNVIAACAFYWLGRVVSLLASRLGFVLMISPRSLGRRNRLLRQTSLTRAIRGSSLRSDLSKRFVRGCARVCVCRKKERRGVWSLCIV